MGLKPSQVTVHGLPIRPTFSAPQQPKEALRRKLGMDKSKPAVLLVGAPSHLPSPMTAMFSTTGLWLAICRLLLSTFYLPLRLQLQFETSEHNISEREYDITNTPRLLNDLSCSFFTYIE